MIEPSLPQESPPSTRSTSPRRRLLLVLAVAGGAALTLALLGVMVIRIINKDGTTVDDPNGATKTATLTPPMASPSESASASPGDTFVPFMETPPLASPSDNAPHLAIAPFDATKARAHQVAWAKHLGVPVEFTNSIGMKFRLIPPGEFTMGITMEEAAAIAAQNPNEEHFKATPLSLGPAHRVRLTQAFYLGKYEVTQEQYERIAGVNPSFFSATGVGKEEVKDEDPRQHPVESVSFIDAAEFCIKLSEQELLKPVYSSANGAITLLPGDGYRLPTEAEWEWACRAGATTPLKHSDQESAPGTVAWYRANAGGRTHSVGQLKANPFGLYDIHGNVWEWCQDLYDSQAYTNLDADPTEDPQGPATGYARVLRGGDWHSSRSPVVPLFAVRPMSDRSLSNGFRVVMGVRVARSSDVGHGGSSTTIDQAK